MMRYVDSGLSAPRSSGCFYWLTCAMLAFAAIVSPAHPSLAQSSKDRVELILSALPPQRSKDYADLLRLAGSDVRVQRPGLSASETWSLQRSRLKRVLERAEKLGVANTVVDIDWNRLLRPPSQGLRMTNGQELVLEALKSSNEALVVGVMASLKGAVAEYALTRNAQGKVAATRPGAKVIIPIGDKESITAVRKIVENKENGWTWRGEVEGTGESVMLMWWKGGRFTGMFTYRGHIYTLRNMGGDIHAILETDPAKLPPDHSPVATPADAPKAALEDDPLYSRGEGSLLRDRRAAAESAKDQPGVVKASLGQAAQALIGAAKPKIVTLTDAKRRQMATKKVTIDVMILHTPKVARKYVDVETDLVALSIEQANESFANSGLNNIRLNLVHHQAISYDEGKGQHFDHLYAMVDGKGPFADVHRLRDEKRADVVALIVDDAAGCGLSTRVAAEADEAYVVVHHSCAALTYSIAHEIGHIIGARHDVALDPTSSPFPYGHGYVNGTKWRDIMSYRQSCSGCPRVPYWSNPAIKIRGERAGSTDADNARVILEQAERVSRFR
jgi:hypothetical protein